MNYGIKEVVVGLFLVVMIDNKKQVKDFNFM